MARGLGLGLAICAARVKVLSVTPVLALGPWFPPDTPVFSTSETNIPTSFQRLDMTLAVAEAISPNITNHTHWTVVSSRCL